MKLPSKSSKFGWKCGHPNLTPPIVTAYLPQVAVYPTGYAHNLSRTNRWRGWQEGVATGELAIRNGRERLYPPRVPVVCISTGGECSIASSVVFRNYDTIPLHPLERCTAARQSLYILHYNRSTSLPVKYITRLDATEATAVNPLWFLVAVICVKICISDVRYDFKVLQYILRILAFSNGKLLHLTNF